MMALDGTAGPTAGRHAYRSSRQQVTEYGIPRLYPSEERRRRARAADTDLRTIANVEAGRRLYPDVFISYKSRVRRRAWFALMIAISVFPFMSILVYKGKFDSALSWYTKGEVHCLTKPQMQVIRAIMIAHCFAVPAALIVLFWRYRNAWSS